MFGLLPKQNKDSDRSHCGQLVWACDYCCFVYHESFEGSAPYLEVIAQGRAEDLICEIGRGDEFADYEVSTKELAIDSALDVLHLFDVSITYNDATDEDLGLEYGQYGSCPEWLAKMRADR